jgi:hypothetical protein
VDAARALRHIGKYAQVSGIFAPMVDVMNHTWSETELNAVSVAMRAADWHPGQHDDMDVDRLRYHLKSQPRGVKPPKAKRAGPPRTPRWRTWSIVLIADTLKHHRIALRKLLGLDVPMEEVPTMLERALAAEARVEEVEG